VVIVLASRFAMRWSSGSVASQARLHDLRHLYATTLLLAGVPVHVVAARLGHADPAVNLRVYAHVLREHAAGVGDIFAQAVNGSRSKIISKTRGDQSGVDRSTTALCLVCAL
jgi:hypothetical protein